MGGKIEERLIQWYWYLPRQNEINIWLNDLKKSRMHHGWGCYHHRLSFVTEVENESVLLIALKIFIHLSWRQREATQARGIQGLVLQAERWLWTRRSEPAKSSCRRAGDGFSNSAARLSNLWKVLLVGAAVVQGCWNFFVRVPDAVPTCVILYISTFSCTGWRIKVIGRRQ